LCSFHELEETAFLSVYAVLFLCYNSITPKGAESLPGQFFFSIFYIFSIFTSVFHSTGLMPHI